MSTSLSLSPSSRVTALSPPGDGAPSSLSPDELRHLSGHELRGPRRLGRVVLMVVIAVAMQAGIVWQLHRSAAARRAEVAMEMRDFEVRARALRAEMSTLEGRIGQTREQLGTLHGLPARPAAAAQVEPRPTSRPPRPASRPPTTRPPPPRPAPIVLTPGCTSTPLGC